jgi:hypothetical protein
VSSAERCATFMLSPLRQVFSADSLLSPLKKITTKTQRAQRFSCNFLRVLRAFVVISGGSLLITDF